MALFSFARFFLYASLFSVVIVMPTTFFPFIGGKYYFFRFCVEFALAGVVLWWAFSARPGEAAGKLQPLFRSPIVIAVSAFVAVYLLAAFFAHDPVAAFWSNYERGEGAFQMLHYYAFFLLLLFLFEKREQWESLVWTMLVAGILVIGYGIVAAMGVRGESLLFFLGPVGFAGWVRDRFSGSLGNAAYTGSYLLFLAWWALWTLTGSVRRQRRVIAGALLLPFLFFLFLTQTRGAFLALIASVAAFLFYLAFRSRTGRRIAFAALAVFLALIGALFFFRNSPAVRDLPVVGRLVRISLTDRSVETRVWVWEAAYKGWKERPLLGWGPENFTNIYDKHFDTRHFVPNEPSETWYDRAHNVFFDYLASAGLLGLLAFLGIFAAHYSLFFRSSPERSGGAARHAILFAFPVAYLVQGLVLFDVLPIYLNLFLFLGLSHVLLSSRSYERAR